MSEIFRKFRAKQDIERTQAIPSTDSAAEVSFGTQLGDVYDLTVSREDRSRKDAGHLALLFGRESWAVDYHKISYASSSCSLSGLGRS